MMTAVTDTPILLFNESRKRGLLILCVFLFPILITSLLFLLVAVIGDIDLKRVGNETTFASIETPANRSIVHKTFEISGSLRTPLKDHSYYLIENRSKLFWPKYSLGDTASKWNKPLTHRAKTNTYASYQIIMAPPALSQFFDTWFSQAKETGQYPGIKQAELETISEDLSNHIVANIKVKTQ